MRKIRIQSGDLRAARRAAAYFLDPADAPGGFHSALRGGSHDAVASASTRWLGSPAMLGMLEVEPGSELGLAELALALQGRATRGGERVRREGHIHRDMRDQRGRLVRDSRGRRSREFVLGTKTVDLTFSAPKSVSIVWSQGRPDIRTAIEMAMLDAAEAMLARLTSTKLLVKHRGWLTVGVGYAAAAALHVTARSARANATPAPQLHVHAVLLGVERSDGLFASPELSGLFKHGTPLEGGAVARLVLAERLVEKGFTIDTGTGPRGRFFEIHGVPAGLIARLSPRTRDVEFDLSRRQAQRPRPLTGAERAVSALRTRAPKTLAAAADRTVGDWAEAAAACGFTTAVVDSLSCGPGFTGLTDGRLAAVRADTIARLRGQDRERSPGAAAASLFECAAGRLRLAEAVALETELLTNAPYTPQAAA